MPWWTAEGGGRVRVSKRKDKIVSGHDSLSDEAKKALRELNSESRERERRTRLKEKPRTSGVLYVAPEPQHKSPDDKCPVCNGNIMPVTLTNPLGDSPESTSPANPSVELVCQKCGYVDGEPVSMQEAEQGGTHDSDRYPYPPPCICGNTKYSIYSEHEPLKGYRIIARCTLEKCRWSRTFYRARRHLHADEIYHYAVKAKCSKKKVEAGSNKDPDEVGDSLEEDEE